MGRKSRRWTEITSIDRVGDVRCDKELQIMQHLVNGNLEALTQASFICILAIAIIILNLLVIATFINFRGKLKPLLDSCRLTHEWTRISFYVGPQEVINIYLLSLAFADLICGIVIVPLSIYPALQSSELNKIICWMFVNKHLHSSSTDDYKSSWKMYGDFSGILCRLSGYIEVTLFSIIVRWYLILLEFFKISSCFVVDLYVYVDISGQILSCSEAIKIWNCSDTDTWVTKPCFNNKLL